MNRLTASTAAIALMVLASLLLAAEAPSAGKASQQASLSGSQQLFYEDPVSGPPEERPPTEHRPGAAIRERIRSSDRPVIQAMLQLPRAVRDEPAGPAQSAPHKLFGQQKAVEEPAAPLELPQNIHGQPAELGKPLVPSQVLPAPAKQATSKQADAPSPSQPGWMPSTIRPIPRSPAGQALPAPADTPTTDVPTRQATPGSDAPAAGQRDPAYEDGLGVKRQLPAYQQPPLTVLPPPMYSESCPQAPCCPPGAVLWPCLHSWLWGIEYEFWLSQGVTFNSESPRNRSNYPVGFNDRSNDYQLNQLYLVIAREVDDCRRQWDVGGRVDLLYGTDWRYVAARGLERHRDLSPKWNAQDYGLAMPQCYMEVLAPLGTGVKVKLGHFYSILGYENAQATQNFFYSHSLMRQFAEPFTHTGLLGSTQLGNFTVQAGMTRGWDNWEAYGDNLGVLAGISWTSADCWTAVSFALHWGPEQQTAADDDHPRTAYSLVWQQRLSERLLYVFQHDWGVQAGHAQLGHVGWYGINQYLFYTIDECWKLGMRLEWFRDDDRTRVTPQQPLRGADYYQASLGLNYAPGRRMVVRPEVRWDWIDAQGFSPFAGGTRRNQFLFACDLLLRY